MSFSPSRRCPSPGASVVLTAVTTSVSSPVHGTNAHDGSGQLFVVERAGSMLPTLRSRALLFDPYFSELSRRWRGG